MLVRRCLPKKAFSSLFFFRERDIDYTIKIFPSSPTQCCRAFGCVCALLLFFSFSNPKENIYKIIFMLMMFRDDPILDLFSVFSLQWRLELFVNWIFSISRCCSFFSVFPPCRLKFIAFFIEVCPCRFKNLSFRDWCEFTLIAIASCV